MNLSEIKKTLITALGMVIAVGTPALQYAGVFHLPPQFVAIISGVVGIATIALNYLVPNETDNPARVAGRSLRLKGEKTQV